MSSLTNDYHLHTNKDGKKFTYDELLCIQQNTKHPFTIEEIEKMSQEWKRTKYTVCKRKEKKAEREQRAATYAATLRLEATQTRMEAAQTNQHEESKNDRNDKHDQTTASLGHLLLSVKKLTEQMKEAKSSNKDKNIIDTLQKKLQETQAKLDLAQVAAQIDFSDVSLKEPDTPIVKAVPDDQDAVVVAVAIGVPDVPGKTAAVVVADKPIVEKVFEPNGESTAVSAVPHFAASVVPPEAAEGIGSGVATAPAPMPRRTRPSGIPLAPHVASFAAPGVSTGVPPEEVDGSGSGVAATPGLRRSRRNIASAIKHKERMKKGRRNKENNQKKSYK